MRRSASAMKDTRGRLEYSAKLLNVERWPYPGVYLTRMLTKTLVRSCSNKLVIQVHLIVLPPHVPRKPLVSIWPIGRRPNTIARSVIILFVIVNVRSVVVCEGNCCAVTLIGAMIHSMSIGGRFVALFRV